MHTNRAVFSKVRALFSIFQKGQGRDLPLPPTSCAPDYREKCDMKKLSVVTLSMELHYKISLIVDCTRNIIMLLSFKCIHS